MRWKESLFAPVAALFATLVSLTCWLAAAHATPTRSFVLDSASVLGEGKLEGTAVSSDGELTRGVGTHRIDLPGIQVARSALVTSDGSVYVGTGNDGKIYALKDGKAVLFAETKQLMVTSLVEGAGGVIYAGTLPSGKIFAIDPATAKSSVKIRELVTPPGAQHIWALVYDQKQKTLYAGTGPEGKVFAIDAAGKADVYYDSEASHIMALVQDQDGMLYAGTSDQALLLRLRAKDRAEVVYDFDGNEVTAIDAKAGELAVVANLFSKAPASKPTPTPASDSSSPAASTTPPPPSAASTIGDRPQAGKGQLYRIGRDGRAEHLFTADEGSLTSVEWGEGGVIYVGTGKDGHVHRVSPDHSHALWVDVDERQILATKFSGSHPLLLTGDGAAIYEVLSGPAQKPVWTSKALDAQVQARFGQLSIRGRGKLSLQTRSGNTDKPDDKSWTEWSSPLTAAGPIRSPAARFLQIRAQLDTQADSAIYALEAFYLPQNQPALVTEVSVEPPRPKTEKGRTQPSSSIYKIKWKTENPDGDSLRFRIYYKTEAGSQWRSVLRETEIVTGSEQSWDTDGVPDGYYRLRVEASDELDNPQASTEKQTGESEPVLVDNHPPQLEPLRVQNAAISGSARDSLGPISKLEYTVDGLEWKLLGTLDGLFDTAEEHFELPLSVLPKGDHVVVIRASDARSNTASAELEVKVP